MAYIWDENGGPPPIIAQIGQVIEHEKIEIAPPGEDIFETVVAETAEELGLNIDPEFKFPPINDAARELAG